MTSRKTARPKFNRFSKRTKKTTQLPLSSLEEGCIAEIDNQMQTFYRIFVQTRQCNLMRKSDQENNHDEAFICMCQHVSNNKQELIYFQ